MSLSLGKYDLVVVCPHFILPVSGFSSPANIFNNAVFAKSFSPRSATFSPRLITKDTFSNNFLPAKETLKSLTSKTSFPNGLSMSNPINGYFLEEGIISSSSIFSNDFLREVA